MGRYVLAVLSSGEGKIGISLVQEVTYDKVFESGSSIDKFLLFGSFPAIFPIHE